MISARLRRFGIFDIMILVAAAAVAVWALRGFLPRVHHQFMLIRHADYARWSQWLLNTGALGLGSCVFVPLMAAMVVIRLRKPRPRRSRLFAQPGFVACIAGCAAFLPGFIQAVAAHSGAGSGSRDRFWAVWIIAAHWVPCGVLGAWTGLAVARRWRAERSWIDRTGRALGVYCVLIFFARLAFQWLRAFGGLGS